MININVAKRLIKRCILANIVCGKTDLAITPLISGKHGIGKSQMIKSIAADFNSICITIEGGTLKEGEITGLPYQFKDDSGNIKFRFLPYYAIERIQNEEKRLYLLKHKEASTNYLLGDENKYADNDLPAEEKIKLIKDGIVKPVIIFIDEINRTENTVYKELMNILLTRSVNGYKFPWWVLFVGAMNPSTQNSTYATNEMDPAQLDRFIKFKVSEDTSEWLSYAKKNNINDDIISFIANNPKCLSSDDKDLEDEEKPSPSPRAWDMLDTIIKSEPLLKCFFNDYENSEKVVQGDMRNIVSAKVGSSIATMYFASINNDIKILKPEELFQDDEELTYSKKVLKSLGSSKKVQCCNLLIDYLIENVEFMMLNREEFKKNKKQLSLFIKSLDSSTMLLFGQKLVDSKTDGGEALINIFYDVFEKDLLDMLDLSDQTKKILEGK